ncbi:MAG: glycoside hydrolase family 15 protein [Candidatus Pacebacteria bacterium]|nr:glycoside hydrolase family 15 protein [Candidatus Paceibacterota bacterium]
MPRSLVLANGKTLVSLDQHGYVRDFYYPYIGWQNHVSGHRHRIGLMINGQFSWLEDNDWQIKIGYKPETMVGYLVCKNDQLGISLVMEDIVYNENNIFIRQLDIYNHTDQKSEVKVFFHQVFLISETKKRNTAFYDPTHNAVVHYKGRRVFIVNGRTAESQSMDDFAVGAYQFHGHQGTYKDAEDGQLGQNAVEHGSVDSTIRFSCQTEPRSKSRLYYWICAGESLQQAYQLNDLVYEKSPEGMIHSTENFWYAWLDRSSIRAEDLPEKQRRLFDTSLLILRAHTDNEGSIIASADSAMIEYGKDDYSYMWPRDAAFIATSLDRAGFTEVTKPFFLFCQDVLHPDGYLHHRYNSDRSLGSTWHSTTAQKYWLKDKILQLPIQEDESAGVLFALWQHYKASEDLEFIENLYSSLIEKIADFLVNFRNKETGLPLPSYDLWEEQIGVSTYTCSAVYGGLMAAADFSELLGKRNHMRRYKEAAKEIKQAMENHLYSQERQAFIRYAQVDNGDIKQDPTIDASSLFGLWYFGVMDHSEQKFADTVKAVKTHLTNPTHVGGIIRYENDAYFRSGDRSNPWLITTMWEAMRLLDKPDVRQADLSQVEETLNWVADQLYPSGVLAEQLDPQSGRSLSATPLVWSHAVYVDLVLRYLEAKTRLLKNMISPKEL